ISDLMKNENFMNLLYKCINIFHCRSDALIGFGLKIINACIEDLDFMDTFIKTEGVLRICSIPHVLSSSTLSASILFKLSKSNIFMNNIAKTNNEMVTLMVRYSMRSYPNSHDYYGCAFLINSFKFPTFYDVFLNEGGVKDIFNRVKGLRQCEWFKSLKISQNNLEESLNKNYYLHHILVSYSMQLLLIHIYQQLYSTFFLNTRKSQLPVNTATINYDYIDMMIKL
ncbi:hypothetical protein HZS_2202, partial [Henneguya salminicola]